MPATERSIPFHVKLAIAIVIFVLICLQLQPFTTPEKHGPLKRTQMRHYKPKNWIYHKSSDISLVEIIFIISIIVESWKFE